MNTEKTFKKDMTFAFVVSVTDGKLDTDSVEEEFYKFLRHNEKSILEDAADWEKDRIISHLNHAEENHLREAHMEQYHGTDDDSVDDYENWLVDLTLDELKEILDTEILNESNRQISNDKID